LLKLHRSGLRILIAHYPNNYAIQMNTLFPQFIVMSLKNFPFIPSQALGIPWALLNSNLTVPPLEFP
jgi:hypothetical protein